MTNIDINMAAKISVQLFAQVKDSVDCGPLYDAFNKHCMGPGTLQNALKGKKIKSSIALLAVRRANIAGRNLTRLIAALSKAGDLQPMKQVLSKREMSTLTNSVIKRGNPQLGEKIYRQQSIACISCHAIGGAGAQIGPDLISIGASAPIDYIIDSLLQPTKKIKEGYHMTMVTTKDGRMIAGSELSATKEEVIIRDALGKKQKIATANIKSKKINNMSMMPPGLTTSLNNEEFIHLVSFLSQLGKEGDFKLPQARFVRSFEVLKNIPRGFWKHIHKQRYQKLYAKVGGALPLQSIIQRREVPLKFDLKILQAGTLHIQLSSLKDISLFSDKKIPFKIDKKRNRASLEVKKGELSIIAIVDSRMKASDLSIEIIKGKSNALVKLK